VLSRRYKWPRSCGTRAIRNESCWPIREDSEWRNRSEFLKGRKEIRAFLQRKWARVLDYRLKKTLWGFRQNRMAVSFEYEWRDAARQWHRSYGVELWEFNQAGLMQRRIASINDATIDDKERRIGN
jgi:nuclear transport factor 2 (NTF2) superfamily protein